MDRLTGNEPFYRSRPSPKYDGRRSEIRPVVLLTQRDGAPRHARRGRPRLQQLPLQIGARGRRPDLSARSRCASRCASAPASTAEKRLDARRRQRALEASPRSASGCAAFRRQAVRAVGTNTLRVAKNAPQFLREARSRARFPDRGDLRPRGSAPHLPRRRARLPPSERRRLVVDIGGGSTEIIIGSGFKP